MRGKVKNKLKRGVYRKGKKRIRIVNWDLQHPRPPLSEWRYCEKCDFPHACGGHLYISPKYGLFFAHDEIAGELVNLGLIRRIKK
jgi:hypothetical protein